MTRFIGDAELEQLTGIKIKTFRNWRLLGKGPKYRKLGRCAKYEMGDVEDWISSCPAGGGGRSGRVVTTAKETAGE